MPFDFQPTLKGTLVELRPLCANDSDELFAVASDPLIWEQHPVRDRHKPEVFRKRLTNTPVRRAGSVLKCPDDRKNRVVSAQANGHEPKFSG